MVKKFTAKELLSKTMPFVWAKLLLRLIAVGIFIGLFALGIWMLTRDNFAVGFVIIIISIATSGTVHFILVRGAGFAIRVGHIAVLTETIKTGRLPENQVAYGKTKVVERIGTAATFFVINKLVDRAVFQLQMRLQSAASMLGSIPGMGSVVKFAQTVLKAALKYVDSCCIAWVFYGPREQSAWKGALDGVTIYAQNWKKVLGNAVKTALMVMVITFVIGVAIWILFAAILGAALASGWWTFFALIMGILMAFAIKHAFIDSWVMISMLVTFLEVAPATEIRVDIYGKLSSISPAFKDLTNRARNEIGSDPFAPAPAAPASFAASPSGSAPPAPRAPGIVFCGQCGAKNPAGTRFCGECGQQV